MSSAPNAGAPVVLSGDLNNPADSTARAQGLRHPTPLQIFELRCQARAMLVRFGALDFLEAVDVLVEGSMFSGLVSELGVDAIQEIMAREFRGLHD